MARATTTGSVDTKRRHSADKARGTGRRSARQAGVRREAVVELQADADASVAVARRTSQSVDVDRGGDCGDDRDDRTKPPAVTTTGASRARVDAAAIEAGRVPRATGTSMRKAKRAATGTSRMTESRASARDVGGAGAGAARKAPLGSRASAAGKSPGGSRTARRR